MNNSPRLRPGLVSITFRSLSPAEIVDLCVESKLEGVEWGGDVHVPAGDLKRAREVKDLTQNAGLEVAAYGSYYRVGEADVPFQTVLETAQTLGAPLVRVWAGNRGAPEASDADFARVARDAQAIAEQAQSVGIAVACEWHGGTLTETPAGAARLLREAAHPNLRVLWQPNARADSPETTIETNLAELQSALPHLENVHVFHWTGAGRHALQFGEAAWRAYLNVLAEDARSRWALLEFVRDDAPQQLLADARTLRKWLSE